MLTILIQIEFYVTKKHEFNWMPTKATFKS